MDQPTCASAMDDSANYACVSNHSNCYDGLGGRLDLGYICRCDGGYRGNPYVPNGCSRDKGNPLQLIKKNIKFSFLPADPILLNFIRVLLGDLLRLPFQIISCLETITPNIRMFEFTRADS